MLYITGKLEGGWLKPRSSGAGDNPRIGLDTGEGTMNRREFGYLWAPKGQPATAMTDPVAVTYTDANGGETTKSRFTTVVFHNPDGEKFTLRQGDEVTFACYYNKRYDDLVFTSVVLVTPAEQSAEAVVDEEVPA